MNINKLIEELGPCDDGKDWLKGKTLKEAWETCQQPDWMYWALGKLGYDDAATYRKLACSHALSVAHLWDMPAIVRQYLETQDERIRDAARAARDAAWAAGAAGWSARAAWAAGAAWAARAAARDAARAARDAAWAAVAAGSSARAAWAAWAVAQDAALVAQCDTIRSAISWTVVAKLIKEARE
jgi:microcompartment protein CcmK/EutM